MLHAYQTQRAEEPEQRAAACRPCVVVGLFMTLAACMPYARQPFHFFRFASSHLIPSLRPPPFTPHTRPSAHSGCSSTSSSQTGTCWHARSRACTGCSTASAAQTTRCATTTTSACRTQRPGRWQRQSRAVGVLTRTGAGTARAVGRVVELAIACARRRRGGSAEAGRGGIDGGSLASVVSMGSATVRTTASRTWAGCMRSTKT
jgi:hypothetical protein